MNHKNLQYSHGGRPELHFSLLSLEERPVIDFSVNINPFGLPEIIRERWMNILDGIESYPSVEGDGISLYYRKKFGISLKNILAGNGSTEMIYLLPRALRFKAVVVITPSYHDYSRASAMAGARVMNHELSQKNRFAQSDINETAGVLKDADALWLGNPNNPTGTLFQKKLILDLADMFPEKWFFIDEAFMPFTEVGKENSLAVPPTRANILVLHSLTKFYGLAGLRLGGVTGHEDVISRLRRAKEPWTVNSVAERVAPLLLECEEYEEKTRFIIKEERKRLMGALGSMEGINAFPSHANFILCQWRRTENLDDLMSHLLSHGIYVRDCRNFQGLEDNFFRLAIRTPEENDILISSLSSFPKNLKKQGYRLNKSG